nr:PREDICTED: nuclear pore complex protein Nup133 [Bemisia tabaci]
MDSPFSPKFVASPPCRFLNRSKNNSSLFQRSKKASTRSASHIDQIYRSANHVVEQFTGHIPVLILEALISSERSTLPSVNISSNEGWAWFVVGRRLFVWQTIGSFAKSLQCWELTLPPSDLAHGAALVSVFMKKGNSMPSCLAVSPEGTCRFWPSIVNDSISVEANADLQGQECDSLHYIPPLGFILVTTTATLVHIQPNVTAGRHSLACQVFRSSSGWLSGIGRRVSSLFLGSMSSQSLDVKLVKLVTKKSSNLSTDKWHIYVLTSVCLQKWTLCSEELEKLNYEVDIIQPIREALSRTSWEVCAGDNKIILYDMQPTDKGVMILVNGAVLQTSQLGYALISVDTDEDSPPSRAQVQHIFNLQQLSAPHTEHEEQPLKMLVHDLTAYVYNHQVIVAIVLGPNQSENDIIELPNVSEEVDLLGGFIVNHVPVFFSKHYGLVSVTGTDFSASDILNSSALSAVAANSPEVFEPISAAQTNEASAYSRMQAAFLAYIQKNMSQCEQLIQETFPVEVDAALLIDANLDSVLTKIGFDLLDDIPSRDPRWADTSKSSSVYKLNRVQSLQIRNQLEEKQRVLDWYLSFVKDTELWNRLGGKTWNGVIMATTYVLAEQAEKIQASISFYQQQTQHLEIIEWIIQKVNDNHGFKPSGGLTQQDLFFRCVSIIHEALQQVQSWTEEAVHSDKTPQQIAADIVAANSLLLEVLNDVFKLRSTKAENFKPGHAAFTTFKEYVPWTAAKGDVGLRDMLLAQYNLTLKHGVRMCKKSNMSCQLSDQLVELADVILIGYKNHVDTLNNKSPKQQALLQEYENTRYTLIQPFFADKDYERATILAEKYSDFSMLIQLCDITCNTTKLDHYIEQYADEGFSKFLIAWYIRENKQARLLQYCREGSKNLRLLGQCLGDHPTISWIQAVFGKDLKLAFNTLMDLAKSETDLLARKKTLLSLTKLILLIIEGEESRHMKQILDDLELISYQENLPLPVLNAYGYDPATIRVFTPVELIKFFICEENSAANEWDFKNSLDLLKYVEKDERDHLKLEIWVKAILRDVWPVPSQELPPDIITLIRNYTVFKTIDLLLSLDVDADEFLPPLETILQAEELSELVENANFRFLLQVGFEHYLKPSSDQQMIY